MVPTVLDALDIEPPSQVRGVTQLPIEGVSFAHTFDNANAPSKHHTQYFEMFGHRSLYHDGWRAVCPFPDPSFTEAKAGFGGLTLTEDNLRELDAKGWELYNLENDPAETKNFQELRVRIDAAKSALAYELPKPEFAAPAGDVVPLHERIRAYARARAIAASEGQGGRYQSRPNQRLTPSRWRAIPLGTVAIV
jgi:arylsulfatase A-like enzyme